MTVTAPRTSQELDALEALRRIVRMHEMAGPRHPFSPPFDPWGTGCTRCTDLGASCSQACSVRRYREDERRRNARH